MAQYGLSLWGDDYYGVDVVISYSVGEVNALQTGYGEVTLTWTTPSGEGPDWSLLRIVRNTYGFPADETDGEIVAEITPDSPRSSYADSGLTGGSFYYYAIFLASAFEEYDPVTLYQQGDTVSYGGNQWLALADNIINVAPENGPYWQAANAVAKWNRAGQASTLAVGDYGYRSRLYELTPTPYATGQEEVTAPQREPNTLLYRYLSVLAFALDMTRTELGEQQHLHRAETMPIGRMETLAQQLGVADEASLTPRLRRRRIAQAAEFAKRRGTIEAIKESVYVQTGYDADITLSSNMLLDADQAEFDSPRHPAWSAGTAYQPGDVVAYNGFLYTAKNSTSRVEAEQCTIALSGAASYSNQSNQSKATYSNNLQVLVRSSAINHSASFTFTIPTTGTYDLSAGLTKSYDYGIIEVLLDGATLQIAGKNIRHDGYAASAAPPTSVYLGAHDLSSGDHTLTFKIVGKNKSSGTNKSSVNGGYQMGVDYLTYTPIGTTTGIGVAPTGFATNNSFWTYLSGVATDVLRNPLNDSISTWQLSSSTPGANPVSSPTTMMEVGGYSYMDGSRDRTANQGIFKNLTGMTAHMSVSSIPWAKQRAWDATTTYERGSYVSYEGQTYMALMATEGTLPDADRAHWAPQVISTVAPDRYLVSSYGIPLPQYSEWMSGRRYAPGEEAQYQGQVYRATIATTQLPPSGVPVDNTAWAWVGSAQRAYTLSAYSRRAAGSVDVARNVSIAYYDASGSLITTVGPTVSSNLLLTFGETSSDITTDLAASYELDGLTWSKSNTLDKPVTSSGMVYWASQVDPERQAFFTYDRADGATGLTFVSYPTFGFEHGLLFRRSDASNYWAVSRTRLTKTVAGVTTALAGWEELPNGARIYVTRTTTNIKVFRHQGPGLAPVQLANITDSFNSTAKGYGIFERPAP